MMHRAAVIVHQSHLQMGLCGLVVANDKITECRDCCSIIHGV